MDWERVLLNSTPFIAMFCLIVLIVITTCARKLEAYENNGQIQPILFDYTDNPKIQSLDEIETPTEYEELLSKNEVRNALQMMNSTIGIKKFKSRLTPDEKIILENPKYSTILEEDTSSFKIPSYDTYDEENKTTP